MTFYEALQILGLDSNFTEEELRKKYLNLVKMYHPDALIGKPEEEIKAACEKMKDINLAYETLKKDKRNSYSDKTATNNNGWNFDFNIYKRNKINSIDNYNYNSIFNKAEFAYGTVASGFNSFFNNYYFDILSASTKEEVDKLFSEFKKGVRDWYIKLKDIYFKKHNIPENTNFTINEDLSFDEFYNNLEKTKEQHQNNIKKEVNDIVNKYKLYAYYGDLKTKIEELKQGTITDILDIPFIDSNLYLNNKNYYLNHLKNDIEILFRRIAINKPLYLNLLNLVNENYGGLLNLIKLKNSITDILFPIYYQESLDEIKHYSELIKCNDEAYKIKNNLAKKYYDALNSSFNPIFKVQITKLYHEIGDFLDKNLNTSFESLILLNDIDFNNYDEAVRIFDKVKRNLITLKDIDISMCKDNINGICVKHIQIDDEEYNVSNYNDETHINESYRIIGNKLTLDEFMEKAEEFFVTFTWNDDDIVALYRFDSIILGIYKGRLEFFKDIEVTNVEVQNKKDFGIYQDRDYVKSMIINEYYKEIELHKKQNNTIKK